MRVILLMSLFLVVVVVVVSSDCWYNSINWPSWSTNSNNITWPLLTLIIGHEAGEKECFWDKMRRDEMSHTNTHSSSISKSYTLISPVLCRPFREAFNQLGGVAFKTRKLREYQVSSSSSFSSEVCDESLQKTHNYNDPSITAKPANSFLMSPFDCLILPYSYMMYTLQKFTFSLQSNWCHTLIGGAT